MLKSFFGPTLPQSKVSLIYELFPRFDGEHTERALLSERHKVSRYTYACNCIYVHKVEARPCLRRFSRNSPSFNKVIWKTHVLNYQNRTQHSRETDIFSTMPLHKIYGFHLTDLHETYQESTVLCEGVLKRISWKVGKDYVKKQNKLIPAK